MELFHTLVTPYRPFPHAARTAEDDAFTRTVVLLSRVKVYRLPQPSSANATGACVLEALSGTCASDADVDPATITNAKAIQSVAIHLRNDRMKLPP